MALFKDSVDKLRKNIISGNPNGRAMEINSTQNLLVVTRSSPTKGRKIGLLHITTSFPSSLSPATHFLRDIVREDGK